MAPFGGETSSGAGAKVRFQTRATASPGIDNFGQHLSGVSSNPTSATNFFYFFIFYYRF
jgi:hypothetical protein